MQNYYNNACFEEGFGKENVGKRKPTQNIQYVAIWQPFIKGSSNTCKMAKAHGEV